ncbi:MAG TPA: hypothetical protein VK737_00810 [Opitutales bacterium]|nr:hypothetical protein [Opitutales bacterium]
MGAILIVINPKHKRVFLARLIIDVEADVAVAVIVHGQGGGDEQDRGVSIRVRVVNVAVGQQADSGNGREIKRGVPAETALRHDRRNVEAAVFV